MANPLPLRRVSDNESPPLLDDGLPAFTGRQQPLPGERDEDGQRLFPYLPSPELCEAVNLARTLGRPLLLKGEPGCGKTRLARAVAYELNIPYYPWYIKSTSRARDGLYLYDAVSRLRDAQLAGSNLLDDEQRQKAKDAGNYIRFGPLGKAFRGDTRTVVLIDEIDKADIDFPNDLLIELEDYRFVIDETGTPVTAAVVPIVIVTSNDEKDLPDAFLRRCIFHYIEFPRRDELIRIVGQHFVSTPPEVIEAAVDRFRQLRTHMIGEHGEAGKRVSTSELIDWFELLRRFSADEALALLQGELPYPSVLLKSWDDHRRFLTVSQRTGSL